jgi:RNA polymerase sigma-70 factor (ECF subfamily)
MAPEAQTVSDEELARLTQAGSFDSFEELVRRYEHRIHGFLIQFRLPHADASAVAQDTLVRAFQAIHQFNVRHTFAPWLFTIARHKAIDHLRAHRPPSAAAPLPEAADLNDPSELLAQAEDRKALWQLAQRLLPDPQFQALWLRYVGDLDLAGIAQVLGKTQTNVKVLLFRARHSLGQELAAQRTGRTPALPAATSGRHPDNRTPLDRARLSRIEPQGQL